MEFPYPSALDIANAAKQRTRLEDLHQACRLIAGQLSAARHRVEELKGIQQNLATAYHEQLTTVSRLPEK
jgi:hypothetical protein